MVLFQNRFQQLLAVIYLLCLTNYFVQYYKVFKVANKIHKRLQANCFAQNINEQHG